MAEEDDEKVEATGNSGGGMVKIILIVNAVLLLIGIAVGVTWFLLSGDDEKQANKTVDTEVLEVDGGNAPAADNVPSPAAGRKPIYVPLNPAFVVNFENQDQVSFLQVDIEIMTYDPAVEVALKDHMPRVRNELLLLLGGKQYHEINNREGKRRLSQDAINEIQRVLKEAGAPSAVEALYFTSFVMQ